MFAASLILSSQKVYSNIISFKYMLLEQEYYFIIIISIIIFLDKAFNFTTVKVLQFFTDPWQNNYNLSFR